MWQADSHGVARITAKCVDADPSQGQASDSPRSLQIVVMSLDFLESQQSEQGQNAAYFTSE